MKLIIAGGRDMDISPSLVDYLIGEFLKGSDRKIDELVSGACGIESEHHPKAKGFAKGVDGAGERWARMMGVPIKRFYANFTKKGKAAGPLRNRDMAEYGDRLLLVWDGVSRGSANMRYEMDVDTKPIYEVILRSTNVPRARKGGSS